MEKLMDTSGNAVTFHPLKWFVGLNLLCLLFALLWAWMGWRSYTLSVKGETVMGTVVELLEEEKTLTSPFSPVVEFEVDGAEYSVVSHNNYSWWEQYTRFSIGKQVEMRYEPGNPENAEISSVWDIWNETIFFGCFIVAFAWAGNAILLFLWRRGRTSKAPA